MIGNFAQLIPKTWATPLYIKTLEIKKYKDKNNTKQTNNNNKNLNNL